MEAEASGYSGGTSEPERMPGAIAADGGEQRYAEAVRRLAHELRTPLAALLTVAEMLRTEQFGPLGHDKYKEYAESLHVGAGQALEILRTALEDQIGRDGAAGGDTAVRQETVAVAAALERSFSAMVPVAEARGVRMACLPCRRGCVVQTDAPRLDQILLNLIGNALKFTPPGGTVTLVCHPEADGSVALEVRDTGIGISVAELTVLSGPQTARGASVEPSGTMVPGPGRGAPGGLGLVMVRALADACGASFTLASTRGAGTSAKLVFPPTRVLADSQAD